MASTGIGSVRAFFESDNTAFDRSVEASASQLKAAAVAAELAGDKITEAGGKIDRAAAMQERAAERARQAWQRELLAQERAAEKEAEVARAREMAALKADILARSLAGQENAQKMVNAATEHGIPAMSAASAAVRTLEGNITHNIRAAERFVSTTLGLAPLLEKAFPVVGAVALGAAVVGVVGELVDFGNEAQDLANTLGTGWLDGAILKLEGFGKKVKEEEDNIKQFQQQIDQSIAAEKESSFQTTGEREGPAAEATARAQEMLRKVQGLESMMPVLREKLRVAEYFATAPDAQRFQFDPYGQSVNRNNADPVFQANARIAEQYKIDTGIPAIAKEQAKEARAQLVATQAEIDKMRQEMTKVVTKTSEPGSRSPVKATDEETRLLEQSWQRQLLALKAHHYTTLQEEAAFWQARANLSKGAAAQYAQDEANKALAQILNRTHEAFQKFREEEARRLREQPRMPDSMTRAAGFTISSGGTFGLFSEQGQALREATTKAAEAQASLNAQWQAAVDKVNLLHGQISPLDASMNAQAAHAEQYRLQLEALNEQLEEMQKGEALAATLGDTGYAAKEVQLRTQIAELENKARISALEDQQQVLSDTWKGAIDSVWDELIAKAQNTQQQIAQIAGRFMDGINSEAAKGLTGGKTDFGGVFRGASQSLMKTGLEKLEGSFLHGLGLGSKKVDGSAGSPFHVIVDNNGNIVGGAGIPADIAKLFGGQAQPSVSGPAGAVADVAGHGIMGWAGKLFGGRLSGLGGIFSHLLGFAGGGEIPANLPVMVGENGPEILPPLSSPRPILSNRDSMKWGAGAGGGVYIEHVDARGTDPALTRSNIEQGFQRVHASAAASAAHAMADRQRRVPR
ncbi:phage tail tape measure family protein [Occallatibacter riparius]|uniref:Bacteriophage tail tape measure C-terminal domain-containing protein n=1 Tax=Occallatibacter riparius TaxID=1002689 RepID=A0A9J7BPM0_9BACT|nr:hypothetical protein [Occallatibacter riparius]UWZ84656.1 hypothetical protein MOP44_01675 [Occallatibacter riparius]